MPSYNITLRMVLTSNQVGKRCSEKSNVDETTHPDHSEKSPFMEPFELAEETFPLMADDKIETNAHSLCPPSEWKVVQKRMKQNHKKEVLTRDEMFQIDDITLSAIDFGLQGYTGTPSASRARPKKKDSSKTPKRRKKEISIPISSMANPPPCTGEASQDPVIATVSTSMVSHPQSIGEASQAQTPSRYDHNVDPFKYVFKKTPKSDKERRAKTLAPRSADEPFTEPHTASKRLDFDDPPQV
ncbi:hypothetical protein SUGI_0991930 [Cryptomeria japonica]|nr:hypothetical protein SUGI_0991930 [Cryptomeria japonica]